MEGSQPVRLAYDTYEPISGTDENLNPVLFLHGVGASKENWGDIPQNVANATKRKTYSLDARNHGESEWSDVFNFDINADDLIHFLETMGIEKAVLVGHSMGGITVIKTALKKPNLVELMVVEDMVVRKLPQPMLDTIVLYFSIARKAIAEAPADLDEEDLKKFVMDYVHSNLPPEMQSMRIPGREEEDNHIANFCRDENGRFNFKANLEVIGIAMKDHETIMSDPQGIFEGPACFIYGKLSPFQVEADEEHIRQFFPNATFEGIEEATHVVHAGRPLEFTDALLKLLS